MRAGLDASVFFLAVVVISIIVEVSKRLRKGNQGAGGEPGQKSQFEDLLQSLGHPVEPEPAAPPAPTPVRRPAATPRPLPEAARPRPRLRVQAARAPQPAPPAPEAAERPRAITAQLKRDTLSRTLENVMSSASAAAAHTEQAPMRGVKRISNLLHNKRSLRDAFILSEVLGPPLGDR